jgi:methylmalonyl-CoA carboxyltransferase large subunit
MAKTTIRDLAGILEQVQERLEALSERVERLESAAQKPTAASSAPAGSERTEHIPIRQPITEEELFVISAALGAYMGVRVRIRQIRLLSSHAWAQQGRVSIQASHNLHN